MSIIKNELPKWISLALWIAVQVILFGYYFWYYDTEPTFQYSRLILRTGLPFARAAARCLNFNCMLILLTVCRNLISFVRKYMCKCCLRTFRRLLDKNLTLHRLCAYAICFWTAVHTVAHCYNVEFFVQAQAPDPLSAKSRGVTVYQLSSLGAQNCPVTTSDPVWVNPVCGANSVTILEAFKLFPALSGVIITMSLITIVLSATEFIRRSYFEIFWFTHHLFVVFFAFLVVHGLHGVVRGQTNANHDTNNIACGNFTKWGGACPKPTFASNEPAAWQWVIAPMVLYLIERLIRVYRGMQTVTITKIVKHPSKVLELQMKKDGFTMEAGQYIFIQCSKLSRFEWHPFTLTSSPEEDFFSVHIRMAGDWTTSLAEAFESSDSASQPKLAVDGPFGTASEDWDQYEVDVLIGAGIGVTPFASILKHIWYAYSNSKSALKLKKVYFYWIAPDTQAFEWFSDLLRHLDIRMREENCPDFMSYNIYLTRGWDTDFARSVALNEEEPYDVVTGLHQKTFYGRPNWDTEFERLSTTHANTSVGVFFCGPSVLSTTLRQMCNKHSKPDGARFVYNKENF